MKAAFVAATAAVAALALIVLASVTGVWPFTDAGNSEASEPGSRLTKLEVDDAVSDDLDDLLDDVFELRSLAFREGHSPATAAARAALLDEFGREADSVRKVRITSSSLNTTVFEAVDLHDLETSPAPGAQPRGIVAAEADVTTAFTYLRDGSPTLFVVTSERWTSTDGDEEIESGQTLHWDAPFAEEGDLWVVEEFEREPEGVERH